MARVKINDFFKHIEDNVREFAIIKHGDQKYGDKDYVYHLDKVKEAVDEFGLDARYKIVAYLHDIYEDVKSLNGESIETTRESLYKEVKNKYGEWVHEMIFAVSGFGSNRKERKENMIEKLKHNLEAINLKMLDRLVNMRECVNSGNEKLLKMYVSEIDDYHDLFSKGNKDIYLKILEFKDLLSETKKTKKVILK